MEKLIEELEAWWEMVKEDHHIEGQCDCSRQFSEILSLAKLRLNATESVAEPLAVLADRKKWLIQSVRHFPTVTPDQWHIWVTQIMGNRANISTGNTYPEAESKARAYLEALPDSPKAGDKGGV